ncbi:GH18 domain-containing protein [Caenorhabditis elegans]|uniref:GH18 domain-containing protein n=1 Tax=Caenorhabditis elegans TaxID=6239 RepID=Q965P2_CAEEL|nr:GH18 domain-containing protein [Caenorhabditis elegans]CCD73759.1 GH18 domain-containing protein [Caenorhabditis elegans]|eukprot:NP_497437.2 CHiTinase [Caenorhabditis elegans]
MFLLIFSLLLLILPVHTVPVACYYILNQPDISKVPKNLCTHIILINSAHVSEDGRLQGFEQDLEHFSELFDGKIELFVSITSSNPSFSFLTSNTTLMHNFSSTVTQVLQKYRLNGVDIDWEFPVWSRDAQKSDKAHFATFLRILKSHLKPADLKLSVAVSGPPTISRKAYDVDALKMYADMVQIMNYDFHVFNRYSNPFVGFNAPLHPMRAEISVLGEMNAEASMKTWYDLGLPRNISFFGIPTYARAFQLLTHYLHKPYSPAIRARPEITNLPDVCIFAQSGYYTTVWNHHAQAPYLYGDDGIWVSYENQQSILAKMAFARKLQVGGVMVFSIGSDDVTGKCGHGPYPLLTKISKLANF